jgi:hypothetical protein
VQNSSRYFVKYGPYKEMFKMKIVDIDDIYILHYVAYFVNFEKSNCQEHNISMGPMASFCEHGNEPSGSIKKAGFFDKLFKCPSPWSK